jgi:hypothetical protein
MLFYFIYNINSNEFLLFPEKIEATSYLFENENLILHPYKLYDQNKNTSYSEAIFGDGINSEIKFYFNDYITLTRIKLFNGYLEKEKYFKLNNRIKKIKIIGYDNTKIVEEEIIELEDTDIKQIINLKNNIVNINIIKVLILEVYKGSKYNDTCLSEINFFGNSKNKIIYNKDNMKIFNIDDIIKKYKIFKNCTFKMDGGPLFLSEIIFRSNKLEYFFAWAAQGPEYDYYVYNFSIIDNYIYLYPQYYYNEFERYNNNKIIPKKIKDPFNIIKLELLNINNNEIKIKFYNKNEIMKKMFDSIIFEGYEVDKKKEDLKNNKEYLEVKDNILIFKKIN